jgi:hypothetical protein
VDQLPIFYCQNSIIPSVKSVGAGVVCPPMLAWPIRPAATEGFPRVAFRSNILSVYHNPPMQMSVLPHVLIYTTVRQDTFLQPYKMEST